jgi:hypothetical protein
MNDERLQDVLALFLRSEAAWRRWKARQHPDDSSRNTTSVTWLTAVAEYVEHLPDLDPGIRVLRDFGWPPEAFAHGAGDRSCQTAGNIGFAARNGRPLSPEPALDEIEDTWRAFVASCKTDLVNIDRIVRIIEFRREQSPSLKAI